MRIIKTISSICNSCPNPTLGVFLLFFSFLVNSLREFKWLFFPHTSSISTFSFFINYFYCLLFSFFLYHTCEYLGVYFNMLKEMIKVSFFPNHTFSR